MGNSVSKKKRNQQQRGMVGPPPLYSNPSQPPHHTTTNDNEYSTNTAHSSNSILINSPTRQQFGSGDSALAHLNPEYSSNRPRDSFEEEKAGYARGTAPNKPPMSQAEYNAMYQQGGGQQQQHPHPHQHKHLSASSDYWPPVASTAVEDNQLTINSMNQLTVNSMKGMPLQIDDCIRRLIEVGYSNKTPKQLCLRASEVVTICRMAMDIFMSQPTLLELSPPVKIVGDTHGQFTDLIRLFEMGGFPPSSNYLFLGDYVDRGKQSLETMLLLLCYKIKYPENFFILRGNHECANVTKVYGFYDECKRRLSPKIWKTFVDMFNTLPIAALVANKIFCVHGGLSPSLHSMDEIRSIERPTDVPDYGLLNDLLWSDPTETTDEWEENERGVSYCFGRKVIEEFLARFDLDLVCRAHMVVEDGYQFFEGKSLVTVFSAPNYCGEFDNFGALMSVSEELLCSFELLTPADHPMANQYSNRPPAS
ncbi:hypothetical protein O0I10_003249 [Lichtheimia ornata]|uniref:Serine/threonine-protein phosphatase n=1 Tax=Lichtheimia ornata TaxID=688661 RepID=A0AAD7Y2K0_9FUNG|nr:uncharacterized protein O0I10_003249 [Lichtheimia ornata]KAJ8661027.1 hypothetical protein O0I10_003249 [Lichtheimia ornata]